MSIIVHVTLDDPNVCWLLQDEFWVRINRGRYAGLVGKELIVVERTIEQVLPVLRGQAAAVVYCVYIMSVTFSAPKRVFYLPGEVAKE